MDEQQSQSTQAPIYQESQQKNAKWLWLLVALIIVAAIAVAYVKGIGPLSRFKGSKAEVSPTPASSASFSVSSPSPEATSGASKVDKSKPKIRVLNGSGVAGAASSFKDVLEEKGYKVASLGNADQYGFKDTVIKLKETFKNFGDLLVSDLSSKYSVTVSKDILEATDSADIEITVGTK